MPTVKESKLAPGIVLLPVRVINTIKKSTSPKLKTVVLVDPLSGGHHEAYMRFFIRFFYEHGWKVYILFPETKELKVWAAMEFENLDKVIVESYSIQESSSNLRNWGKLFRTPVIWRDLHRRVKGMSSHKADLVYFTWLDSFLDSYYPFPIQSWIFPHNWSGLYFHPKHLRYNNQYLSERAKISDIDIVLKSRNCVGLTIHDRALLEGMKYRYEKNHIVTLPEFADLTSPDPKNEYAIEIKKRSGGRLVIGMLGLAPHQGIQKFCELHSSSDPERYFFVYVGVPHVDQFNDEERKAWNSTHNLDNQVRINRWLKEGEEYNSVFSALDVPFLVYRDFTSSSNRLTKAAHFRKLVLASNKYLVGEDVRNYDLGEVVDEDNLEDYLKGIELLFDKIKNKNYKSRYWNVYTEMNSYVKFEEELEKFTKQLVFS